MENKDFFLGLDIGTDSVGYAVTDTQYSLLKYRGEPAWGSMLFDKAELNTKRRSYRTARRRLDRRQQRVQLLRELFAPEIAKIDPKFFARIDAGRLLRSETDSEYTLFNEAGMTDIEYHRKYPTIHHLIDDLMLSEDAHDARLVYLACAWLVANRGHFLSEVNKENIAAFTDFDTVWNGLIDSIRDAAEDAALPWRDVPAHQIADVLKKKTGVTQKNKQLCALLFENGKAPKKCDSFPYSCEALLKAICGGKINAAALFGQDAYEDIPSFALSDPDENLAAVFGSVGDDAELLIRMKAIFDWCVLVDILSGTQTISAAKIKTYEQHRSDLALLKKIIKKYKPEQYKSVFRSLDQNGYAQYSGHFRNAGEKTVKKINKTDFSSQLKRTLKGIVPDAADAAEFEDMLSRIDICAFLPKQRDTDNRVIPYQLYWHELNAILQRAECYLPFLSDRDSDGLSVSEKIISVFTFRIPYYVGPLNKASKNAWLVRKANGRILPWNFDRMVDRDASEEAFIRRMTNDCTYLPGEKVLPRESLLYHRFTVLNEINKLKIDGEPVSVALKQTLYTDVYEKRRRVTLKILRDYLQSNGYMTKESSLSGVDDALHSDLKSYHDFKRMLDGGALTEAQVEEIINRITLTEDEQRLKKWLKAQFSHLSDEDIKYISRLNYKDFGRLSRKFLTEFEGVDTSTGEMMTIIKALWDTNDNLMELLSDRYTFAEQIRAARQEYYIEHPMNLDQQLTEMRLSNAVKRPVIRALDIIKDVRKAFGCAPKKVFIEMTRGATADQKNKRTKSRRQQLMELYEKCDSEDVRILEQQLRDMGDSADTLLQSDRLYLYYMQLGRCMYSDQPIDISAIKGERYNIEHIYPQVYVKDDSIINNEVLVQSELNGQKSDVYPIDAQIRSRMYGFWKMLHENKLLADEKFKRLTRATPFSADEKLGFINRQLTETSQSTKAVAEVLRELYPEAEIVYVKARLASEFRQEFDLVKSRAFNDLHHAKDAYLNIVVGSVYDMKFSKRWFDVNSKYSIKTKTLFTQPVVCGGTTVWDGTAMLEKVKRTMQKNNAHMTQYAYCKQGKLFETTLLPAKLGLIPIKRGLPTEKYGGYNSASVSFFLAVRYRLGKKKDIMIVPVERMYADHVLDDERSALTYAADRICRITGKEAQELSLPLGLRPIKKDATLSLDGFRVTLSGTSSGGQKLITAPFMAFIESQTTQRYIKRLEVLAEKVRRNPKHIYDARYDCVTPEENLRLYDLYIEKLEGTIFSKRPNNPIKILREGRNTFIALSAVKQAQTLLNMHQIFSRNAKGIDLSAIGGGLRAAATQGLNTNVSNWAKTYSDVRIIDASASGLWEKRSENLLKLL